MRASAYCKFSCQSSAVHWALFVLVCGELLKDINFLIVLAHCVVLIVWLCLNNVCHCVIWVNCFTCSIHISASLYCCTCTWVFTDRNQTMTLHQVLGKHHNHQVRGCFLPGFYVQLIFSWIADSRRYMLVSILISGRAEFKAGPVWFSGKWAGQGFRQYLWVSHDRQLCYTMVLLHLYWANHV